MKAGPSIKQRRLEFDPEDLLALQGNPDPVDTEKWCRKIFECVDVDGSGFIDANEMRLMLEAFFTYLTKED